MSAEKPTPQDSQLHKQNPSLRERTNAVIYTLHANQRFQSDAILIGVGGAYGLISPQKALSRQQNKEQIDSIFANPLISSAVYSTFGLFGKASIEVRTKSKIENKNLSAKERIVEIYNRSLIPHVSEAWKTGKLQLLDPFEKPPREKRNFDKFKELFRRK